MISTHFLSFHPQLQFPFETIYHFKFREICHTGRKRYHQLCLNELNDFRIIYGHVVRKRDPSILIFSLKNFTTRTEREYRYNTVRIIPDVCSVYMKKYIAEIFQFDYLVPKFRNLMIEDNKKQKKRDL